MKPFRNNIVLEKENVKIEHKNDDEDYNMEMEEDIGNSEDRAGNEVAST